MRNVRYVVLTESLVFLFFENITDEARSTDNLGVVCRIVFRNDSALVSVVSCIDLSCLCLACCDAVFEVCPNVIERNELDILQLITFRRKVTDGFGEPVGEEVK